MTLTNLTQTNEGLRQGTRKDGHKYSVRDNRQRYFYPDEWDKFEKEVKLDHMPCYEFLIQTGVRIDEALHIRPCDFDLERSNVRIWKTKTKAKKGEKVGKPRTLSLNSTYLKRVKKLFKDIKAEDYLFTKSAQNYAIMLKRALQRAGIKDWYMFSLHNIRKTHGMWLKALGIDSGEICLRLGHDMNTFLSNYGSAEVFSDRDITRIKDMFGDLYNRKRGI